MSADLLRRAAALMRKRAEATAAPHHPYSDKRIPLVTTTSEWSNECADYLGGEMGDHCASWHPAVALAVADWLESTARFLERGELARARDLHAIRVARAYLGEDA